MSIKVKIPTPLQKFTKNKAEVECEGKNIIELINNLDIKYPGIKERLCDEQGKLRRFINFFVNEQDIRFLQGEQTPLKDGDEVSIIPAIAGGKEIVVRDTCYVKNEFSFDFERLEVYKLTVDFVKKVFQVSEKFPKQVQYSLGDQFRRAALSIANNIAEGSGKQSAKEKIYFYNTALNSCRECIPIITVSLRCKYIDNETHNEFRMVCIRICEMLIKLIKSVSRIP